MLLYFTHFSLLHGSSVVSTLVDLAKKREPSIQAACLGVMQNLSLNTAFHRQLLEGGVLEALDSCKDVDEGALGHQCAAVLYNFSLNDKSVTQMMELGCISIVTHLSYFNVLKVRGTTPLQLRLRRTKFLFFVGCFTLNRISYTLNTCTEEAGCSLNVHAL